jgi:glycine cleavage system transcriptional repressor
MHVALTAVGVDRPGIVAAVSRAVFTTGGNIEDSRMAILGGHFAVVLIVSLPSGDVPGLEAAIAQAAGAMELVVSVRPVPDAAPEHAAGAPFVVRVYGADKPGIVARVSECLAERAVNIRDLATHVLEGDTPVYVMLLDVTVPGDVDEMRRALEALAADIGVDVSIDAADADTL